MEKNALEASRLGETVTVGCQHVGRDQVRFWVNNPAFMSQDIQNQVFKRSLSTKGAGHGLGTFSMKLLREKYLGGKVDFHSRVGEGTTFEIVPPLEPRQPG